MKEARKKHKEEYWRVQTQVENQGFQQFREERLKKQQDDLTSWRTSVCKIAYQTQKKLDLLTKKEDLLLESMRRSDIKQTRKRVSDKLMLNAMEIEQNRFWPSLSTLDSKIDSDVIIPQTVLNFGEYQAKLQKLAILYEQGKDKEMQSLLDNQQQIDRKNKLLQPIFREMKGLIRHMSFNPEFELMREYITKRNQFDKTLQGTKSPEERTQIMLKLKKMYAAILAQRQNELRNSTTLRLKTIQKRLEDIFELLNLWNQYVDVVYMSEAETNMLEAISQMDARPQSLTLKSRGEQKELENRLNMLFGEGMEG